MRRRYYLIIFIFFVAIIAIAGLYFERSFYFEPLKQALQCDSISTELLNYGEMGKILKKLDYVHLVGNDNKRFKKTTKKQSDLEIITFQKKRRVGECLFQAGPYRSTETRVGETAEIREKPGWPVLSIDLPDNYLHDPVIGILANRQKNGKKWERKARVSIIKNGQIVFSSAAGLRVHGGKRRKIKPYNGYRLYFREEYGEKKLPDKLLFDNNAIPIRTLVIQTTDWPPDQPLNNPVAYDLARRIDCLAPQSQLVELYLNHRSLGMAFVTEHQSRKQWQYHLGHQQFVFYKFRSDISLHDNQLYHRLFWKPTTGRKPLTMKKVGESIDLDNLSRQMVIWAFCGTTDYCQGVAVFDELAPEARLYWLVWDMDHSFYDYSALLSGLDRESWQQPGYGILYGKGGMSCGRTVLFTRLMKESPEYREYHINLIVGLLNHRLTRDFLLSRVSYYQKMLESFGSPHIDYILMLQEFMVHRPDFMRKDIGRLFGLKGPFRVNLQAPEEIKFDIDGYDESGSYEGSYFYDNPCTIGVKDGSSEGFSYWLVDGEKRMENPLQIKVKKNTEIEVVFAQ